ncbi:unnamed protein product [Rhizoctonia solani]|nr:unnamed protein product [Rhizoctonia solani]
MKQLNGPALLYVSDDLMIIPGPDYRAKKSRTSLLICFIASLLPDQDLTPLLMNANTGCEKGFCDSHILVLLNINVYFPELRRDEEISKIADENNRAEEQADTREKTYVT